MIFGKIDYINLLPLHLYLKRSNLTSYAKKSIEYKKDVPARLNRALFYKKIDAAIISSIESKRAKYKKLDIGICANKRVLSVLVRKNSISKKDAESATSNALARVLGLRGSVIIGDKALREYMRSPDEYVDMCEKWYEKTRLPFMFARLSTVKNHKSAKRIFKGFIKQNLNANQRRKIPKYILDDFASTRGVSADDIKNYLNYIYYKIGKKEKKALKIYINKTKYSG